MNPIDCRQCKHFINNKGAYKCGGLYMCIDGSQYKPTNFIQLFRKSTPCSQLDGLMP